VSLVWKFGLIAFVALVLAGLPGGDSALDTLLAAVAIAFFTAIALLGYRLYNQFRDELGGLPDRNRAVLYGSIGLAFLAFCATGQLFDAGGGGVVAWLALLAASSYGVFWVWSRYRAYE
jgi:hypothetical protein